MEFQKNEISTIEEPKRDIITEQVVKVNGEVTVRTYQKLRLLGKGGFATCYLVKNLQNGVTSAAKIISKEILKNARTKYKLDNEIKLHKTLHHQNIVELYNSFEDENNVNIFLEVCPNETLNEMLFKKKRLKTPETQKIVREIISAVKYLHSRNIIHRDLKLGNIFLGEGQKIKIGDFGLATKLYYSDQRKRSICGTPNYIAPEIIDGQGYSYAIDIWSIGVIIYTLMVGTPPFETENVHDTYDLIKKNRYEFPEDVHVNPHAKKLIQRILVSNPADRPTLDEILQSSFFEPSKGMLKQLNNANNTSIMEMRDSPMNTIKMPISRGIYVKTYMELENESVSCMSNGLVCLDVQGTISLYNRHVPNYIFFSKDKNGKEIKTIVEDEEIPPQFEQRKIQLDSYRCLSRFAVSESQASIYVKKVMKHKDFYAFRLSNQTVHLKFGEQANAIVSKNLDVTFFSMDDNVLFGSLKSLMGSNNIHFKKYQKYIQQVADVLIKKQQN